MEAELGAMDSDPKKTKNLLDNWADIKYKKESHVIIRGTKPQDSLCALVFRCYVKITTNLVALSNTPLLIHSSRV